MIPLRDSTRRTSFPYLTVGLISINLLVFLYQLSLPGRELDVMIYTFGLTPSLVSQTSFTPLAFIPFITSMFLHAGWLHLIGNMWTLWLFGDNLEDTMGRFRFIVFYLICGLVAGITHYTINPMSEVPVIGASGAIAGVMGAYFLMFRNARVLTFVPPIFIFELPAWIFLGFWALSQVWSGATELLTSNGGQIAVWAHVGGFIAGMIIYRYFLKEECRIE
ncbi:MAG TPA: rhomboid family intramembrane serine protease [Syntrophomonadaceae bacterium]|nr:rhomboid family intramembrane serine protease [Syntrophomonadaceae bacterium]